MTSSTPMKTAARQAARDRRLGPEAACMRCGIANRGTLLPVSRTLLEAHHVFERANDETLTVPLCRNCHAILTEGQRSAGLDFEAPPTLLHQLSAILTGLFLFLREVAERGLLWVDGLRALIAALDARCPAWRTWPEAAAVGVGS